MNLLLLIRLLLRATRRFRGGQGRARRPRIPQKATIVQLLKRLGAFSLLIGASLVGITGIPLTLIPPHWPGFGLLGAATILITGAIILGFRRPNTPNRTH